MGTSGGVSSAKGGQVGIETKKSAARSAKAEARTSVARGTHAVAAAKRPSAAPPARATVAPPARATVAPPAQAAKKKSVPPPAASSTAANDNDKPKAKTPVAASGGGARGRLPTGSLHTEAREPAHAENIKARLTALMNAQQKLAELKRSANKNFYEIGEILHRVRDQRLFEVKGYSSFENYIEREVNLGQQFCMTAVRIFELFLPQAATALGFARLSAAVRAIDDESTGTVANEAARGTRSPIPPHKL
jgi:hypothetical protein